MNDNFQKLAEQAERTRQAKVEKFLELLRDPDLSHIVAMLRNGHALSVPKESSPTKRTAPVGFRIGNGIQEKIKSLTLAQRFTSEEVFAALNNESFNFVAKDPRGAVRDALHKLTHANKPEFRMVRKGKGGQSSIYERIPL
jgi:hypothetical protein